jgi:hypothetical protein
MLASHLGYKVKTRALTSASMNAEITSPFSVWYSAAIETCRSGSPRAAASFRSRDPATVS